MDEEITEELSWNETTTKIKEVAAEVLGGRPKAGPDPMPSIEASELKKVNAEANDLFARARVCANTEEAWALLKESRAKNKELRAMMRQAVNRQ